MSEYRNWQIRKEGDIGGASGPVRVIFHRDTPPSTEPERPPAFETSHLNMGSSLVHTLRPEHKVFCKCGKTYMTACPTCKQCPDCAIKANRQSTREWKKRASMNKRIERDIALQTAGRPSTTGEV